MPPRLPISGPGPAPDPGQASSRASATPPRPAGLRPGWPARPRSPSSPDQPGHHGRLRVRQHPVYPSPVQEHRLVAEPRHLRVVGDDSPPVVPPAASCSRCSTPRPPVCAGSSAPGGLVGEDHVRPGNQRAGQSPPACCWPPDSSAGRRRSCAPDRPHPGGPPACSMSARPAGRWSRAEGKSAMFSATVSSGSRFSSLEHESRRAAARSTACWRWDSRDSFLPAQPHRAGRGPFEPRPRNWSSVDLPDPETPSTAVNEPRGERQRHPVERGDRAPPSPRSASSTSSSHHGGNRRRCGFRSALWVTAFLCRHVTYGPSRGCRDRWCHPTAFPVGITPVRAHAHVHRRAPGLADRGQPAEMQSCVPHGTVYRMVSDVYDKLRAGAAPRRSLSFAVLSQATDACVYGYELRQSFSWTTGCRSRKARCTRLPAPAGGAGAC